MAASKNACEGKLAGLYDLDRTLGKGHFAVVRLARHIFTGQLVAVKVIDKTKLDAVATGHLLQEVRCMKLVQHPNVVRLYEVIDTQTKLYLILELGDGGDMYDYILRHERGVTEGLAKRHFAQIVRAIAYCHRLHVVHRDLKPENVVFFREQGAVKLTDFGFSNLFQPGTMLMTSCGSLAYSAPEILLGEEYDAPAVDVWSLGVILYMLVCGHPPFQEANDSETLTMIMDCRYTVPPHVSDGCKDLISHMLQREPASRASLEEIEGHPWLHGVDPSPAGRATVPISSHRTLSQDEHEAILQAMTGGNIAERDTIQEALEADRYNHITATYYLLGERILREKQEAPVQAQEVVSGWPKPQQFKSLSTPLNLSDGGIQYDPLCETYVMEQPSGATCRMVPDMGDRMSPRPPLLPPLNWEEQRAGSSLTPVKNICALQQICEEEEEEEEEEKHAGPPISLPAPNKGGSAEPPLLGIVGSLEKESKLTAPEPQGKDRTVVEELHGLCNQGGVSDQNGEQSGRVINELRHIVDLQGHGTLTTAVPGCVKGPVGQKKKQTIDPVKAGSVNGKGDESPERSDQGQREDWMQLGHPHEVKSADVSTNMCEPQSDYIPFSGQESGCCETPNPEGGGREALLEHNNNTLPKSKLLEAARMSSPGGSPRGRPRNRCVDLGPDGVESRGGAPLTWSLDAEREEGTPCQQSGQSPGHTGTIAEIGSEPGSRVAQAKVKNVNLRERLLQFPLCEKALSLNIQPASKEKLVPFAQYNCCHVL
ncbi:SNF related kinase b [Brienomyrus brachyistius]|uniref:SNF related kinase b n=1 Tax=Brienomyrus brachyistius TaxID=42636 RepID=UPI0020B437F7|nr:SNF related kinase b [Brienomyrus brachyistius]XP_048828274.1 SNF related kinase b [Brienomyrus brachyistius]